MKHIEVAIVGAGVAGLAAARALDTKNYMIFEKSRGPGGRLASKRIDDLRVDIGAQFFTAREPRFQGIVSDAIDTGFVKYWRPRMGTFINGQATASPDSQERFVGAPYMNAMGRYLAQSLTITTQLRIATISRRDNQFHLTSTDGELYTASQVLVTVPVDQMTSLLPSHDVRDIASRFTMEPTWTVVSDLGTTLRDRHDSPLDALFGGDHSVFDFISTESSKPGRESTYVVTHAKPDWSAIHIEDGPANVQNQINTALETTFGVSLKPVIAHRWRFARPTDPTLTTQKGVFEIDDGLWIAGDYLAGGRVEGAYLSGIEAAERLNR
jgi:predicted NAD/FAD-dependent oxidoreductase